MGKILTTKVKIDGGGHLAHLILSFDFVQSGIGFDHVVELKHHQKLVALDGLYPVIWGKLLNRVYMMCERIGE